VLTPATSDAVAAAVGSADVVIGAVHCGPLLLSWCVMTIRSHLD
jgi:hypothetical protein